MANATTTGLAVRLVQPAAISSTTALPVGGWRLVSAASGGDPTPVHAVGTRGCACPSDHRHDGPSTKEQRPTATGEPGSLSGGSAIDGS